MGYTNGGVHKLWGGAGEWVGAPGTARVRGEGKKGGVRHTGAGRARPIVAGGSEGGAHSGSRMPLEGGAEPKKTSARQLPPGRFRFRLVARLRPGFSRQGPLGLPLSTRTLSCPGVHDPELHLATARSPGPSLPGGARFGDAPSCPRPDPPPGSPRRVGASEGPPAVPAPGRMEGRGCSRGITQQAREGLGVLPGFISVASAP